MNTKNLKPLTAAIAFACSVGATANEVVNPYELEDDTQVTLSGKMVEISDDEFLLKYSDGAITVELEDWERGSAELGFTDGMQVTVFGELDKDLFTASTIEAEALYLESSGSYVYASGQESAQRYQRFMWSAPETYEVSDMTLRGRVMSVDMEDDEFTIVVGDGGEVTVKTAALSYDPLDPGSQNAIDIGDWVKVSGRLDYGFFSGKTLRAESISAPVGQPKIADKS